MKIFDFTTNRRSYLISQCLTDDMDYNFYYSSGRKTYLTENLSDLGDVQKYCPKILSNKININDLYDMLDSDIIIVTSMSMLFKEYEKEVFKFLNAYKGKIVAVDYAWESPRRANKRKKNGFRRGIDALAVVGDRSCYKIPFFKYSQPEIDILSDIGRFINKEYVIKRYNLPKAEKYILVTSHDEYSFVPKLIKTINKYNDVHVIWKLKEKKSKYTKTVKKIMKKCSFKNYTLISAPPNKPNYQKNRSNKDFLSPVAELSLIIDCHINTHPVSYSNMEMMRAGIPTYVFDHKGFHQPKMIGDMVDKLFNIVWTKKSLKNCYSSKLCLDKTKCEVKVDDLFFTKNFLKNLKTLIH